MSKKLISLLLCLVMLISLVPALGMNAFAADENGTITNPEPATDESGKLNLTKNLVPGANGTYDITMESWASGEVKTQGITEKIPTDFVVVVDQSGSMSGEKGTDMPVGNPTRQDNKYLEDVAAGRYYFKDGDNYYRVYGVKDYLYHYYPSNYWWTGSVMDHYGTERSWFMGQSDATTNIANAFYFREVVDGVTYYQPIKTTVEGKIGTYYLKFSYPSKASNGTFDFNRRDETYVTNGNAPWYHSLVDGSVMKSGGLWWVADKAVRAVYRDDLAYTYSELASIRTGMYINYPMYDRHVAYTKLCYRDINGVEHTLTSNNNGQSAWEFCDADENAIVSQEGTRPTYSNLYTFPSTTTRIAALKEALNQFAGAVANETDDFGAVDNRVAIVGFSSLNDGWSGQYDNTEILTGENLTVSSNNGVYYSDITDNDYATALVKANDGQAGVDHVNAKVNAAINAITANGGTQPEYGLEMAYNILTKRGEGEGKDTYTIRSGDRAGQSVDRNTIVIFFTDGQPGDYHYSDQYAEANEVVAQAKQIKDYGKTLDYGTSIFSIGVFGESDGNPLTYDARNDWVDDPSHPGQKIQVKDLGDKRLWEFLGGWMETYEDYYCLRRQWRPNNADGYPPIQNDTIYDYMSVVSSNYPDAKNFIAPAWLDGNFNGNYIAATDGDEVRQKSTAETTNKYYRMASNQDTLVAAFLQAVTMSNEEITSDTSVPLNETAIFKDKVNLADFDTSGATYTVKWQPVKEQNGQVVNNGNAETKVNGAAYPAEGINYSGFNYSANFVTSAHPGQKLVITINGLTPKKTVGELKSNDGNAGVYGPEDEEPTVSITSPTLQYSESAAKTYLIDYNAKMTVATDVTKMPTATSNNGAFNLSGTNVTYQLSSGNQASKTAEINKAYTGVDTATVYGKLVNVENAKLGWNQITTVPASSVYYDDDLAKDTTPAVTVGDGSGKITGVNDANVSRNATNVNGTFYFTFYGTGIDVYCTTHSNGGFVSAAVFTGSGESACVKANRVGSAKTVRDYSAENIYNTPSVFFDGLPANTYTLKLVANDNAQFKLDGVRVYNPVKSTEEGAATAAATELAKTPEAYANYLNLRKVLLNDTGVGGFTVTRPDGSTDTVGDTVSGVLFIDDMSNIKTMSHYKQVYNAEKKIWENEKDENGEWKYYDEELPIYATEFDAYKANGPKNEIYLDGQQGITFQLSDKVPVGTKVWIGLSAPVDGSGSVSITGKDGNVSVNSVIDMYYDFTVPASRQITITNQAAKGSGDIISVTNLKITGIADLIPAAAANNEQEVLYATKALFRPMTMKSVRMAANNGTDPEEETPAVTDEPAVTEDPEETEKPDDGSLVIDEPEETVTPTPSVTPDKPAETGNTIQKVIQSITKAISSFFKSIFRR